MIPLAFLIMLLSPLRLVLAHDAQVNLTGYLSTDSLTADVALLDGIQTNALAFVETTRVFYTKHFPANYFRTGNLTVNNDDMKEIERVRNYLIKSTSLNFDIDMSGCAFDNRLAEKCKEPEASIDSIRWAIKQESYRTEKCAQIVSRLHGHVDTLTKDISF